MPSPAFHLHESQLSLADVESWAALGAGGMLLLLGTGRRRLVGLGMAAVATPLIYRGVTGRWPGVIAACLSSEDSKSALAGDRGIHVRESVRVELPVADVYRFWRRLDNLPSFMAHLDRVTVHEGTSRSHWIARGPAGLRVEWDAEIINEVENQTLGWRSLPGSDVVTAGSVNFDAVRGGRSTQVTVHLKYAPPSGKAGAFVAKIFGSAPDQTIREDLRRLKQILEAGELAQVQSRARRS